MRRSTLPLLAVLLLLAGTAQAVYVATPLRMTPTDSEGNVGDELVFDVAPSPDANRSLAGQTLRVRYGWDPNEGQAASEGESAYRWADAGSVTLDAGSRATLRWTIPAEVDDRNVVVSLVDGADEPVAFAYVRVGDAEPQMRALGGDGGGGLPEPAPSGDAERQTPMVAPALAVALVALLALMWRSRPKQ